MTIVSNPMHFLPSGTTFDFSRVFKIRHPVVTFCNDNARTEEKRGNDVWSVWEMRHGTECRGKAHFSKSKVSLLDQVRMRFSLTKGEGGGTWSGHSRRWVSPAGIVCTGMQRTFYWIQSLPSLNTSLIHLYVCVD